MRKSTTNGGAGALVFDAAAEVIGTTVPNAVSLVDLTLHDWPANKTPQEGAEASAAIAEGAGRQPRNARSQRLPGLGGLRGIACGVGAGAVVGLVMSLGWPTRRSVRSVVATIGAMVVANAPLTMLRVHDPTTWTAEDWVTDVMPHLAYGASMAAVLHRFTASRNS